MSASGPTDALPLEWACDAPATLTPVPRPPGVEGLPDVESAATARGFAEGEIERFDVNVIVVEREQEAERTVFDVIGPDGLRVEELIVVRGDDGWVLSELRDPAHTSTWHLVRDHVDEFRSPGRRAVVRVQPGWRGALRRHGAGVQGYFWARPSNTTAPESSTVPFTATWLPASSLR